MLVVDPDGRVLLFAFRTAGGGRCWVTPGGALRPGETPAAAGARELREETGIDVPPAALGPVIAVNRGEWRAGDTVYAAVDSYFRLDLAAPADVDTAGQEAEERSRIERHAWWHPADLAECPDRVLPPRLADLLLGRLPLPAELPWRELTLGR